MSMTVAYMNNENISSVLRSVWHRVRGHRIGYHFHTLGGFVAVRCSCGERWAEHL